MDCNETDRLLDAYIDGELELTRQLDLEAHLSACPICKKAAEAANNFRLLVRMNMLVYKAPPQLKATIRAALRKESGSRLGWVSRFWLPLTGMAGILLLGLSLAWAWIADAHHKDRELIAEAISDHSRSLLANHLLDMTSSDQHAVKPWLTGKLDFSPPVPDLADLGYKLLGGRIDLLGSRPVPAIVYQYQGHFINVFVWPAASHAIDFDVQSQQGYSFCGWNKAGLNYLIISELSPTDMEKFEDQLRDRTE
jgi:anti-sigma factor RsiW